MNKQKYDNMTATEYIKLRNEKYKKWLSELPQEVRDKYKYKNWISNQPAEVQEKYKNKCKVFCEVCNKEFSNKYTHFKSKKHIELVAKQQIV